MESYKISSWFAEHEESSKFYQVFAVWSNRSPIAHVVTHWGPIMPSGSYRPAEHGNCKRAETSKAEVQWEAERIRNGKKKRGYRFFPAETVELTNTDDLRDRLWHIFKDGHASVMFGDLINGEVASGESDENEAEPSEQEVWLAEQEAKRILAEQEEIRKVVEEAARIEHQSWGTW